uniref:Tripartite motif-containing protein 16-like n=1 Tax=Oryzias latipes TaxID=8090 RepID=A0A3P9KW43_ORYLA
MAQFQLDESKFTCSICLDLLKEPVTIPCGHSYCMSCIESHWNVEDFKTIYSCPECRHTFQPRPALRKNTVLAGLVEDLKRTGGQEAPHSDRSAGPGDVACDFCTGRKLKAIKSCLQCLVSYCELHLQPHYESLTFQKHKLVEASPNIQENICSLHNSTKEIFCRSDQELICYHSSVENHQGHNTISAVMERTSKQEELRLNRKLIQESIQNREAEIKLLKIEVEAINTSADGADRDSQKAFNHFLQLLKIRISEVQQTIRSSQQTEVSRAEKVQKKLQQEITDLRKKDLEMEKLLNTEDNNQILLNFPLLSSINTSTDLPNIKSRPLTYFEKLTAAVFEVTQKLHDVLKQEWTKISQSEVDVLLTHENEDALNSMICSTVSSYSKKHSTSPSAQPSSKSPDDRLPFAINPPRKGTLPLHATPVYLSPHEPKTTTDFLQYSCQITLDPNTMNKSLTLSGENRRVTREKKKQRLFNHAERFADQFQVLSRESLTGRCYWEVEWNGMVSVAVSYNNINRKGQGSGFGENDKSWALYCHNNKFIHNSMYTVLTSSPSSRVGVYLDYKAGILCFYSVAETRTLLHRVETKFAHPLHAGLCVSSGAAEILHLL